MPIVFISLTLIPPVSRAPNSFLAEEPITITVESVSAVIFFFAKWFAKSSNPMKGVIGFFRKFHRVPPLKENISCRVSKLDNVEYIIHE